MFSIFKELLCRSIAELQSKSESIVVQFSKMNSVEAIRWCWWIGRLNIEVQVLFRNSIFFSYPLNRQPRFFFVIWITVLLGFGEANISTAVQGALVQPPSPTALGCHKRLYTYRITQADENGIGKHFTHFELFFNI